MRHLLVAIAKNEDKYIEEWVNYHLNLGFDKIIIYDNNDIGSELKYSKSKVDVIHINGVKYPQINTYNKSFLENADKFDWIAFIDLDEFINLGEYKSLDDLLPDPGSGVEVLLFSKCYSDNNLLDVENEDYSVRSRFTELSKYQLSSTKSFRSCHPEFRKGSLYNPHGFRCRLSIRFPIESAWIDHYITKSIGEYIRFKLNRGSVFKMSSESKYSNLNDFWKFNEKSDEKLEYAEKLITNLNSK